MGARDEYTSSSPFSFSQTPFVNKLLSSPKDQKNRDGTCSRLYVQRPRTRVGLPKDVVLPDIDLH